MLTHYLFRDLLRRRKKEKEKKKLTLLMAWRDAKQNLRQKKFFCLLVLFWPFTAHLKSERT